MLRGMLKNTHSGVVADGRWWIVNLAKVLFMVIALLFAFALCGLLGILGFGLGSEPRTFGSEPSRLRIRTKLASDPNQAGLGSEPKN